MSTYEMPRLNRASFLSIQVYCTVKPNLSAFAPCTAISFLCLFLVCDNKFLKTLPTSHFLLKILKVYSPRGKCIPNTVLKMGMALFRPICAAKDTMHGEITLFLFRLERNTFQGGKWANDGALLTRYPKYFGILWQSSDNPVMFPAFESKH